jgi:hypothetical protein
MWKKLHLHLLAATILVLAVLSVEPVSVAQDKSQTDPDLMSVYKNAIYDAAVYKFSNVRPLKKLEFDPKTHTARVVTLTGFAYTPGKTKVGVDVWVTAVPEVQNACRSFTGDIALRLRQLLGFPPAHKFTNFVVITVKRKDIFRPAANPDPTTTSPCDKPMESNCGEAFPQRVSKKHVKWLANQMLSSYIISESDQARDGYPWTRLGYTYDWRPGSNKYGASEFVIRKGSKVKVEEIVPYETYCRSK